MNAAMPTLTNAAFSAMVTRTAPPPELETAIGQIDEVITQIATPALARRTRKESEAPVVPPSA
jgi:hypothetical protein